MVAQKAQNNGRACGQVNDRGPQGGDGVIHVGVVDDREATATTGQIVKTWIARDRVINGPGLALGRLDSPSSRQST